MTLIRIKFFFPLVYAILTSLTLFGCAAGPEVSVPQPLTAQQQQLAALPPAFREVLAAQPEKDQQVFLARSADEQNAIVEEWQRREKMVDKFSPTERTIIWTLSQDDNDEFFKIPEDQKEQQETFLADAETRYLDLLDDCLVSTHRRFGPRVESNVAPQLLKPFTPPEQAVIKHLSTEESKEFMALAKDQQEQSLSDTVNRKVEQLLMCENHSNRRLGEPI